MARLTESQWMEVRAEWESSPQQGLTWLIKAGGGRWEITEEAIRRRRLKDGWQKRGTLASVSEKAQIAADQKAGRSMTRVPVPEVGEPEPPATPEPPARRAEVGGKVGSPTISQQEKVALDEAEKKQAERSGVAEQAAVSLRATLLERHRTEWNMARKIAYEAAQLKDFEKAKLAKITTETLRNIQEGERKAWGLDAVDPNNPANQNSTVVIIERTAAPGARVINSST